VSFKLNFKTSIPYKLLGFVYLPGSKPFSSASNNAILEME
jgi:hypothetical protein